MKIIIKCTWDLNKQLNLVCYKNVEKKSFEGVM